MSNDDSDAPNLRITDSHDLRGRQQTVFDRFHDDDYGRVCVDAGAGTGKTATLIRTVAQTIVEEDAAGHAPFEKILLTTFSNDAAHELKTRLKAQLREHDQAAPRQLDEAVWRNIETNADIGTIDGFFYELLQEIAVDIGIPVDFDVRESVTEDDLVDRIFEQVRSTHAEELRVLSESFPPADHPYGPLGYRDLVLEAQQKCREYCWTPQYAEQILRDSLDEMHAGEGRPTDVADVQAILEELVPHAPDLNRNDDVALEQFLLHVRDTYDNSLDVIEAFGTVLAEFETRYDELTRREGALSHTDITFLLVRELEGDDHGFSPLLDPDESTQWRESLANRYQYLFVDEFQDTSFAQCRVLSHLVRDDPPRTQLLLIGDVKQSIYEWRSAEPELFGDIIETARENDRRRDRGDDPTVADDHLEASGLTHVPLTLNFRSHPDIIEAANRLFGYVFDHDGLGAIGDIDIDYEALEAFRDREPVTHPHVHVMDFTGDSTRDDWVATEARRVADTVATILADPAAATRDGEHSVLVDPYTKPEADEPVPPSPGDITLLFRSRSRMEEYAQALRQRGIRAAVDSNDDLFKTTEVKLIIDILEWFANPHSRPSLLRILRSPLVAVEDETLRALTRYEGQLQTLLDKWPPDLPDDDRHRIEGIVALRDDLRWSREEAKSDLVHKILRHSGFEAAILADPEAIREYGNLWMLTEIVDQWEDEELLAYRELVDRLTTLRDLSPRNQPDFTVAPLASEQSNDAVILTTVHASKGREFPIVFLVDLLSRLNFPRTQHKRLVYSRRDEMALRPQPSDVPLPDGITLNGPDRDDRWMSDDRSGSFPTCTGPIWLSDDRDADGHFAYGNPLNRHLEREAAEEWRNLYVAFTRAADHVFFGLCSDSIYNGDYTTWMVPMRDVFTPEDGLQPGVFGHSLDDPLPADTAIDDPDVPAPFAIGIDELQLHPDRLLTDDTEDLMDVADFLMGQPDEEPVAPLPFRPRSLTASAIHDALECPRRYQYQHVQSISPIAQTRSRNLEPPGNLSPATWGDVVHEALEAHLDPDVDFDLVLRDIRRRHGRTVANAITDTILENFRSTETARRLDARVDEADVFTEESFETTFTDDSLEVILRGTVDLLFKDGGDWYVVDYKTGDVRPEGSYERERYRVQLQTYAWLLSKLYDIEVRRAELIYVHDGGERHEVSIDRSEFESDLETVVDRLALTEDENGRTALATDPDPTLDDRPVRTELDEDTRCGSCPFGESKGGPCRFG